MKFTDALDMVKQRYELNSDYKLCLLLDTSRGRIANYRISKRKPSDEFVLQIKNLLELPQGSLLLDVRAEFAESSQVAAVYKALKLKLTRSTLPQAIVIINFSIFLVTKSGVPACLHQCILCKIAGAPHFSCQVLLKVSFIRCFPHKLLTSVINDKHKPSLK